jgi:hypothetical protein
MHATSLIRKENGATHLSMRLLYRSVIMPKCTESPCMHATFLMMNRDRVNHLSMGLLFHEGLLQRAELVEFALQPLQHRLQGLACQPLCFPLFRICQQPCSDLNANTGTPLHVSDSMPDLQCLDTYRMLGALAIVMFLSLECFFDMLPLLVSTCPAHVNHQIFFTDHSRA